MFRAKLQEGFIFRKIVEAIKDVVSECNLQIDRNGKSFFWHWNFLHINNYLLQFFQKPQIHLSISSISRQISPF